MSNPAPTLPAAPAVGDKLTLTIDDIAFGGEGVARSNGFVVFVPFVLVGETVEAEIIEAKQRFARSKLLRILQPAPERVAPRCRYFGECGGCQYQHIAYPAQLRLKHKQITDLFQRLGGFDPRLIEPVLPCPQPYGYRNRIMIRSQWDKVKQGLNIGFIRADNRLVVDIEECQIAEPALNAQIKRVRAHPPPKGGLKVVLRIPPEGWQVPADSFFQNNFFLLPKLVEVVGEMLLGNAARFLVDVYCGVGFFSLELAHLVERFVGVELDAMAIKSARLNAIKRHRTNGEFLAGTAEQLLPGLLARFAPTQTAVLLDPPRKGCQPHLLETLLQVRPSQLIYISCHPATMARDLKVLCAGNTFEIVRLAPLDMFPQTQHVECVAHLQAKQTAATPDAVSAAG